MSHRSNMPDEKKTTPFPPHLTKAAQAMYGEILGRLKDENGVHAETAVSAAARLAGMFLLRSFNLNLTNPPIAPGTPVLSDQANEAGPALIQLLAGVCGGFNLPIDPDKVDEPTPKENRPHLSVLEIEKRLEPACETIRRDHHLDDVEAARACTVVAALLIRDTQQVLDPNIGFGLALYGFVEGTKTAPVRRSTA